MAGENEDDEKPSKTGFSAEYVKDLREEAKGYRLKMTQVQKDLETATARIAELEKTVTETKAKAEADIKEANANAQKRMIESEVRVLAVAEGILDPDALKLADMSKVKMTDDGKIDGVKDVVEQLKKDKPYLFKDKTTTSNTDEPPKPGEKNTQNVAALKTEDYAAARAQFLASA